MPLKHFTLGFFTKVITGLDDTITHVPIIASLTKTKLGKLAFSIGMLFAISIAIIIAIFFSSFIKHNPYYRYIMAVLVFLLAIAIYFDFFIHEPRAKAEEKILKLKITAEKFSRLMGIGFIAALATVFDDIIAYSTILLGNSGVKFYVIAGIFLAAILEILAVIYFSQKIKKIKYKKEIASVGLILLGILVLSGII